MSVELFVQTRDGDYNFHLELEDKMAAYKVIELIRETQGYWYGGMVEFKASPQLIGPGGSPHPNV